VRKLTTEERFDKLEKLIKESISMMEVHGKAAIKLSEYHGMIASSINLLVEAKLGNGQNSCQNVSSTSQPTASKIGKNIRIKGVDDFQKGVEVITMSDDK